MSRYLIVDVRTNRRLSGRPSNELVRECLGTRTGTGESTGWTVAS